MAYRIDRDLQFLAECSDQDLNDLVYCLTHDSDGKPRHTEELTGNDKFKKYNPQHSMYWQEIAAEIQCFGGNTIMTLLKGGKGVYYEEILTDVCEKMIKGFKKSHISIRELEKELLMSMFESALKKMSPDDMKKLAIDLNANNLNLAPQGFLALAQMAFKLGGFKSYQLTLIIANAVSKAIFSRGLSLAGNAALTRGASILTGPIGLVIAGLWTAIDLAGPAYRVTIPAVINIALLRQKHDLHLSVKEYEEAIKQAFDIDEP